MYNMKSNFWLQPFDLRIFFWIEYRLRQASVAYYISSQLVSLMVSSMTQRMANKRCSSYDDLLSITEI